MNCLCEALGIALPVTGQFSRYHQSGTSCPRRGAPAPRVLRQGIRFRDIVTADAIRQRGCSRRRDGRIHQHLLHVIAVAHEAGVEYPLARFNDVAERSRIWRKLAGVGWASAVAHPGCRCAAGVSALLKELAQNPERSTSMRYGHRQTVGENIENVRNLDQQCIDPSPARIPRAARSAFSSHLAPDAR